MCHDSQGGLDTIITTGQNSRVNPRTYGVYRHMYRQKDSVSVEDGLWEKAAQNMWYRWAWYTTRELTLTECLICADAPGALLIVVPEQHTSRNCAVVQQRECREGTFTSQKDKRPVC